MGCRMIQGPSHSKRYNAPSRPMTNCITTTCNTCTCRSALYFLKLVHPIVSLIPCYRYVHRRATCMKMHMTRLEKILSKGTIVCWGDLMCLNTPFTHGSSCMPCGKGIAFRTALGASLYMPGTPSGKPYIVILINRPSQYCVSSHPITPLLLQGGSHFHPLRGNTSAPTFLNNFPLQATPSSNCHPLKDGTFLLLKPKSVTTYLQHITYAYASSLKEPFAQTKRKFKI